MQDKLFLDNASHISSKEAAQKTGYTSDYISRLCRNGKLDAQLVGKNWFVSKGSLEVYFENYRKDLENKREQLSELRKAEYQEQVVQQERQARWDLFYSSYIFGPLVSSRAIAFVVSAIFVFGTYLSIQGAQSVEYRAPTIAVAESSAIYVYENISDTTNALVGFSILMRDVVYGDVDARKQMAVYIGDAKASVVRSTGADTFWEGVARFVYTGVNNFFNRSHLAMRQSGTFFENLTQFPFDDKLLSSESSAQSGNDKDGLVVVPSSGVADEIEKEKIRKTFSDEVAILADADGTSGVVKPVFKEAEDQDYLFVLVPVKEDTVK